MYERGVQERDRARRERVALRAVERGVAWLERPREQLFEERERGALKPAQRRVGVRAAASPAR